MFDMSTNSLVFIILDDGYHERDERSDSAVVCNYIRHATCYLLKVRRVKVSQPIPAVEQCYACRQVANDHSGESNVSRQEWAA